MAPKDNQSASSTGANPQEPPVVGDSAMLVLCVQNLVLWYKYRCDLMKKLYLKSKRLTGDITLNVMATVLFDCNLHLDGTLEPSDEAEKIMLDTLLNYAEEKGIQRPPAIKPTYTNPLVDAIDTTACHWTLKELQAVGELVYMGEEVIEVIQSFYGMTGANDVQKSRMNYAFGFCNDMLWKWKDTMFRGMMNTKTVSLPSFPADKMRLEDDDL